MLKNNLKNCKLFKNKFVKKVLVDDITGILRYFLKIFDIIL